MHWPETEREKAPPHMPTQMVYDHAETLSPPFPVSGLGAYTHLCPDGVQATTAGIRTFLGSDPLISRPQGWLKKHLFVYLFMTFLL